MAQVTIGEVRIVRYMEDDGDVQDVIEATDTYGNDLPIFHTLSMLVMATDTVLHPPEDEEDK